jgi:hypothetical protein
MGGSCSPSPCPVGSCCNDVTGVCASSIQTACGSGSTWFSAACSANPCPQPPPPANDACASAIYLTDGVDVSGTTVNATFDAADGAGTCGGSTTGRDVWYRYIPATSASVNVNTCGSYPGYDTVLSVFTGACGSLTQVVCNDDSYSGGNSACGSGNYASGVAVSMNAGVNYYIRISGYSGATGVFQLRAIGGGGTAPMPPANDNCQDRQGVGVGAPIAFDTTNATTDGPSVAGCSFSGQVDKDIWYNYPAQTTGDLTVSTCGSSFNTRIAVYHTSLCNQINNTTLVGCNDDFACAGGVGDGTQSQLTVPVILGDSYTIRIGGAGGAGGPGTMLLSVVSTLGACCDSTGACHTLTQADCAAASGAFQGLPSSCSPSPCAQPGACCNGTSCSFGLPSACTGSFQGANVACGAPANPTTCCRANFDAINGLQVADIFAFLNAWFAGDPRADVNGGGLAVADIFAFLNLWFAGC